MRKFAIVLALALLPAVASAQENPPQGPPGGMRMGQGRMMQNSIEWILTQKEQFKPSGDQVAKLEALAKALNDSTAPIRDEMRKAREAAMTGGGDPRAAFQAMRPQMEKMRKMDDDATENALKVLNDEQQKVVKDLLEQRRKDMEARRRPQ